MTAWNRFKDWFYGGSVSTKTVREKYTTPGRFGEFKLVSDDGYVVGVDEATFVAVKPGYSLQARWVQL